MGGNAIPAIYEADIYFAWCDVYGSRTFGGKTYGFRDRGEVSPFEFGAEQEITALIGNMLSTRDQVIGSVKSKKPPEGSCVFQNSDAETVADVIGAKVTIETRAAETLTAFSFTASDMFGEYTPIGKQQITPGAVIKNAAGTTTYINWADDPTNADYKIDYVSGLFMPVSSGDITEGQSLTITGELAEKTQTVLDMKESGDTGLRRVMATVRNIVSGEEGPMELYCVRVVPAAKFGISSKAGTNEQHSYAYNLMPQRPRGGNSYGTFRGLPIGYGFALTI
jgi:hypothetical protein